MAWSITYFLKTRVLFDKTFDHCEACYAFVFVSRDNCPGHVFVTHDGKNSIVSALLCCSTVFFVFYSVLHLCCDTPVVANFRSIICKRLCFAIFQAWAGMGLWNAMGLTEAHVAPFAVADQ